MLPVEVTFNLSCSKYGMRQLFELSGQFDIGRRIGGNLGHPNQPFEEATQWNQFAASACDRQGVPVLPAIVEEESRVAVPVQDRLVKTTATTGMAGKLGLDVANYSSPSSGGRFGTLFKIARNAAGSARSPRLRR